MQLHVLVQAAQAAHELRFCTLWAADNLHQFIGQFFICCLQPFQVPALHLALLSWVQHYVVVVTPQAWSQAWLTVILCACCRLLQLALFDFGARHGQS